MTLSENLHNLGVLIKTNLERKGVAGLTGNEGLTTLANKMLDSLTLMGLPQVIQKDDTSYIGAKLIVSGNPVANETIHFNIKPSEKYCADYNSFSQLFTENSLGGRGYESKNKIIRFTASGNTKMSFISDTASNPYLTETLSKGEYIMAFYNSPFNLFEVINGEAVFVKNISAPSENVWFDFEKNSSNNNVTNIRIYERITTFAATTNKNGMASIPYVGTSKGAMTIEAKYKYGDVFLQGTCEVFDCWMYDDMETDKYLTNYRASNSANISYSTEYAKSGVKSLKWAYSPGASNAKYLGIFYSTEGTSPQLPISPLLNKKLRFEIDTQTTDTVFYLAVYIMTSSKPTWSAIVSKRINSGEQSIFVEFTVPSNCTSLWIRANTEGNSSGTLYIDNWKIYSTL